MLSWLTVASLLVGSFTVVTCNGAPTNKSPLLQITQEEALPIIPALNTEELLKHVGKEVIVEGVIVGTYYAQRSKGQPTFLNFHAPYQGYFTALIWGSDRYKFPPNPESYYLNKKVRVRGIIKVYKGAPEIILDQPSQIQIVE
jgi:hypothetical protein